LDIKYQRSIHLKFQRSTNQVFFVSSEQLHHHQLPAQEYWYGSELRRKILPWCQFCSWHQCQ